MATKIDNPKSMENLEKVKVSINDINPLFYAISSVTGDGIERLLWKTKECLATYKEEKTETEF